MTRGAAVAVGCAIAFATMLVPVAIFWNRPLQPKVPVTATVTKIYTDYGDGCAEVEFHIKDIVIAYTDRGLRGSGVVFSEFDRCHEGDLVNGWQQGITVEIDPKTCGRNPSG